MFSAYWMRCEKMCTITTLKLIPVSNICYCAVINMYMISICCFAKVLKRMFQQNRAIDIFANYHSTTTLIREYNISSRGIQLQLTLLIDCLINLKDLFQSFQHIIWTDDYNNKHCISLWKSNWTDCREYLQKPTNWMYKVYKEQRKVVQNTATKIKTHGKKLVSKKVNPVNL